MIVTSGVTDLLISRKKCFLPPFAVGGLSPCQRAQQNASAVPFGTSYLIRCKQDGSYEEVQCSGSTGFCWCVDKNGGELAVFKTRGPLKCPVLGKYAYLTTLNVFTYHKR